MPIKKCKYCKTRMSEVLYGMYVPNDDEPVNPFKEFRGCIVMEPIENWRCSHCDSKIVPRLTPKAGICLDEGPAQLNIALRLFASRINRIAVDHYSSTIQSNENFAELICDAYNKYGEFDWQYGIAENFESTMGLVRNHKQHGDHLLITICPSLEWRIYFDGTGQVLEARNAGEISNQNQAAKDLDFPEFTNLHTKLDELITGQNLIHQVIKGILEIQPTCTSVLCGHDKSGPWEDLQLLDAKLNEPNARLSEDFPSVEAPFITKKENA
jgi:hypothetical protein